ncbi:hypothetical protein ACFE04_014904 [Oxalis oulophora]
MQQGGSPSPKKKEGASSSLSNKLNINEEYTNTFRTKSYIEMWSKAHTILKDQSSTIDPSSSSSPPFSGQLSENFLDPRQETLKDLTKNFNFHHLLLLYFEASLEACNLCELLLQSINQTRYYNKRIKNLTKRVIINHSKEHADHAEYAIIFQELARFSRAKNPFSTANSSLFQHCHESNLVLLQRLTSKHKRIKRNSKLKSICKKIMSYSLIASHSALVITLIVIALHSLIGLAAAPLGLVICFVYLSSCKKKMKKTNKASLGLHVDMAAKGVFILMNDLDTISALVRRLHDEIKHRKTIGRMCVRYGRSEVLKEVVNEFYMSQTTFIEQLDELEKYVYLCFHNINRSRRLLVSEIVN